VDTVSKSYLKTHMLRVFREVEKCGKELIVTDHNKPVLKIVPIRQGKTVQEVFGGVQGKVVYHDDINTPTDGEWGEL
jgi:antitoxin (DNA-binding transcriptional repressor) of toxin-antitoxin stability system